MSTKGRKMSDKLEEIRARCEEVLPGRPTGHALNIATLDGGDIEIKYYDQFNGQDIMIIIRPQPDGTTEAFHEWYNKNGELVSLEIDDLADWLVDFVCELDRSVDDFYARQAVRLAGPAGRDEE
jgi:hypothetical protein